MCIRDRLSTGRSEAELLAEITGAQILPGLLEPDDMVSLYPVSYTHLRAHETVLDLVCRLLLETKTTHITKVLF